MRKLEKNRAIDAQSQRRSCSCDRAHAFVCVGLRARVSPLVVTSDASEKGLGVARTSRVPECSSSY